MATGNRLPGLGTLPLFGLPGQRLGAPPIGTAAPTIGTGVTPAIALAASVTAAHTAYARARKGQRGLGTPALTIPQPTMGGGY